MEDPRNPSPEAMELRAIASEYQKGGVEGIPTMAQEAAAKFKAAVLDQETRAAVNAVAPARQEQFDHLETVQELRDQLKATPFAMVEEVITLREQRDRADMTCLKMAGRFQHREAFMLMTYISEGGQLVKRIWNSRDGVTPFQITIENIRYTHSMLEMTGPFFDRPEGCEAQWETRTVRAMMAAWGRSLDRAVLLGRLDPVKAEAAKLDASQAQSWNLHIGLRSLESGKYTDEA